jgi:uncharacterized protein
MGSSPALRRDDDTPLRVSSAAMGKFLLLILVGVVLYLVVTRAKRPPRDSQAAARPADATMTRCAYCGLHVPADESVAADAKTYCCDEHRRLGQG